MQCQIFNTAFRWWASKSPSRGRTNHPFTGGYDSPKEVKGALEDIISNHKLQLAIKKLSKDEKKILALSIENYSTIEIAKKMKLSEKTIRNKKSIIRIKIKEMLGE